MLHQFEQNGYNIALDSASGAVHVLSPLAASVLREMASLPLPPSKQPLEGYSEEKAECWDDLYSLYEDGTLFSDDIDTENASYASGLIKSMCLHVSHDCNMRCRYCFAGTGDFHRGRQLMDLETGKRAIDFLLKESGPIKNLELDFFGGEPLLNFGVVKELVRYGREKEAPLGKNIRFTITTNGALLDDDSIAFINEHMSNAVLSVDGRREVNDRNRPFEDGSGSYDTIIPKFRQLVRDRTADWYVRGTYTRDNLDFAEDVLSLNDEGFDQISVEPVVLPEDNPMALREEDLPVIEAEYERLAKAMIERYREGRPFTFFHFMIDLDAGPCVYKRLKGCGCGAEYVAVTPGGDIYPCHQFVEYPEYKMGNVNEGKVDRTIQRNFMRCAISKNSECKRCWAKYFCGGGCPANNYAFSRDIEKPYKLGCDIERKRVECALMIKAAEAEIDEERESS
ncbi:MAG: thioether cross-link-forming SCIFF peptide maturase [Clostridiales bacterium]|jgi:uncharacterized protein|nr:thioether cross-link-forming SCIFF peptide maturase [Clostridiales bacterium]